MEQEKNLVKKNGREQMVKKLTSTDILQPFSSTANFTVPKVGFCKVCAILMRLISSG